LIPTPNRLLDNPSQMLFTILLTCALSESIRFLRSGRPFHLLAVSAFLGSAFLARGEGLWVLLLAFPGIAVLHASSLRKNSRITAGRMLAFVAAYFLPFVLIASLYMVLFWSSAHSLDTGLATRSYQALEAGQALSYPERYQGNLHIAGIPDSRAIYGTAAENQSSVVNAFFRNPAALIQRVVRNVWAGPQSAAQALGGLAGILVALFAAGGAVRLLKDRQGILPVLFLFFSLFLLLYLPFFWLTDYFLFLFPALFFLAAKGIVSVVEGKASWLLAALGLLAAAFLTAGIFAGSMRFFFFGLVLLMVWLVGITALRGAGRPEYWLAAVGAAFLLMSNPTYATRPDILPDLQADPMAQTAVWLWGNTQPTDTVAGWGATAEYLAGRPFLSLEGYLDSPATLYAWLIDHRVAYLYQNDAVKDVFPAVYESADSLVAQGCLEPFPDAVWGTARILRIQSKCGTGE